MSDPAISLVIATYNRAKYLDMCLYALTKQTFQDFEVIVTDAGSDEDNVAVAEGYRGKLRIAAIKRHEPMLPPSYGQTLNNGLGEAKGWIVLPLQADFVLAPMYLGLLMTTFETLPRLGYHRPAVAGLASFLEGSAERDTIDALSQLDPDLMGYTDYPRMNRWIVCGLKTLVKCNDWRLVDGLDVAVLREDCPTFDTTFVGKGHFYLDWVYRLYLGGASFWCNPLMREYHQGHHNPPHLDEHDNSYEQFAAKHGANVWKGSGHQRPIPDRVAAA